jgi:hypothetical protein
MLFNWREMTDIKNGERRENFGILTKGKTRRKGEMSHKNREREFSTEGEERTWNVRKNWGGRFD